MSRLSCYNIISPGQSVTLEPFARFSPPGRRHNHSKSAVRVLEVMELFARSGCKMKARQVAHDLNLSPSTIDQLLKTLVDSCFLTFDPKTKYYWPSPRLGALAQSLSLTLADSCRLGQLAEDVRDALGLSVNIAVSQGTHMQVAIRRRVSDGSDVVVGTRMPLFGTSSGAAWLASQSRETLFSCIARCRRELGRLADRPETLMKSIELVRHQGYAFGGVSARNDFCGISIALPPSEQSLVHVVSVFASPHHLAGIKDEVINRLAVMIKRFASSQASLAAD